MIGEAKVREQLREPMAEPVAATYRRAAAEPTYWMPAVLRRVSWGAIIGGTVAAMAIQLMLTTLGIGIGMAAIEPAAGDTPGQGFGIAAGIWWLVTGLISLFVGGMVAGRMAGNPVMLDGLLHGLHVWALSAVLGLFLLTTTVSSLIGGVFGPLARGMGAAAGQTVAEPGTFETLVNSAQETAREVRQGAENTGLTRTQPAPVGATTPSRDQQSGFDGFDNTNAPNQTRTTQREGETIPAPTRQEVREAADTAADAMAQASLWTFFALLLGAGAASLGGYLGRPPMEHEEAPVRRTSV